MLPLLIRSTKKLQANRNIHPMDWDCNELNYQYKLYSTAKH